jgi:hypothetical protein
MQNLTINKVSLADLLRHAATSIRCGAAKLTHVGEQTEPISTIVIQVYYCLPSLESFRSLHAPGISYGNDALPVILNFSVSPDECRRILEAANQVRIATQQNTGPPSLSFTAFVHMPERIEGAEILLTHSGGIALHRALAGALDPMNGIGRTVLAMQRGAYHA